MKNSTRLILSIKDLSKTFGSIKAVDSFSYTFKNGIYGLLGENGAGKTTLLKMICCLIKSSKGIVSYSNNEIFSLGEEYKNILGYLPQSFGYYPDFTALEFLEYVGALKGLNKDDSKKRSLELLKKVNLLDEKNKTMKAMSGGMTRRIGIAQSLLNKPKILILDEPTAGLDPKERIQFRNIISSIANETIVILSTHIVSDIASIADEVIIMKKGILIAQGSANDMSNSVKDRVWGCSINEKDLDVMQTNFLVSNIKSESNGLVYLKIVSNEKPMDNAINIEASVEDAYLYYISR